jgi:WD40 repeat protein
MPELRVPPSWLRRAAGLVAVVTLLIAGLGRDTLGGQPVEPGPARPAAATDRYGDPLPPGAVARLGTLRLRHPGPIRSVAFAPNGRSLLAAGDDSPVRRWAVPDGKPLGWFEGRFGGSIYAMAQSADGKTLATWGADQVVRVWDAVTGKQVRELAGARGRVTALAFSADGTKVAGARSPEQDVLAWDIATGKQVLRTASHPAEILALAFAPDGAALATATLSARGDGSLRLWDARTGELIRRFSRDHGHSRAVAFLPDGKTLVSAEDDGTVRLWDVASGREVRRLQGHRGAAFAVAVSPDGKSLASGGEDRTVRLWAAADGRPSHVLAEGRDSILSTAFSPDGRTLAAAGRDRVIRVYEAATGKLLSPDPGHGHAVADVSVSPDGRTLASAGSDGTIRLWRLPAGEEVGRLDEQPGALSAVAFAPDGTSLASGGKDGVIRVWSVGRPKPVREFGRRAPVQALAFAPDGTALAVAEAGTAANERGVRLYDPAAGKELRRLGGRKDAITTSVAFSPDGRTVASGEYTTDYALLASRYDIQQSLNLWDPATGTRLGRVAVMGPGPRPVRFSPDGRTVVGPGEVGAVDLWEVATARPRRRIEESHGEVQATVFSPDGRLLALGLGGRWTGVRVRDLATGNEVARFDGQQGEIRTVRFTPDGSFLVTAGGDTTLLLWDVRGLSAGRRPPGPADPSGLWQDLGADNPRTADRAMWALVAAGDRGVAVLRDRVRALTVDPRRADALVADLDSDRYAVREAASTELGRLGDAAGPALRRALAGRLSAEANQRATDLLARIDQRALPAEHLQLVRALEVLERIGSPEARAVLEAVAKGAEGARLTEEARSAVRRLRGRAAPK